MSDKDNFADACAEYWSSVADAIAGISEKIAKNNFNIYQINIEKYLREIYT